MGTVLKAREIGRERPARSTVAFNFEDMAVQARTYLDQVRQEAAKILHDARQEATKIRKKAAVDGAEDARRQAEQQVESAIDRQMKSVLPALAQAAQKIEQERQTWLQAWEGNAVHLATKIAEHVIRREVATDASLPTVWVREALALAAATPHVNIHLHPEDLESLGAKAQDLARQLHPHLKVTLTADDKVTRSGCRLTSQFGEIDQQIESHLARIEEEINGS